MIKLVVMIPAYNEENTIGKVVREIPAKINGIDQIEILVINDGSEDRTVEEALNAGAHRIMSHKTNLGLAKSFRDGLNEALSIGADIIVNTDADFQYNQTEIPKLIEPILQEQADIVIGDRQIEKLDHMPKGKYFGNKIATWVTRRATGWPVKDAQTGFRAFSREAARKMNLTGEYTYVQETLIQAAQKDLTLVQIPIEFRRREGKSRLIANLLGYAASAGVTISRSYRDYNPLKVFSGIGIATIFIGVIFGSRVLVHYWQTGMVTPYLPSAVLTTVLVIVGLLAFIFGLLADMIKTQKILSEEILYRLKE
ncbi:glycosyltransferase family 2 protein [Methanohalophilus euhalobius]|jgi:glycosyltransferase involved in cell wall biosynthesis|uniref:Glycosyltransferase involved in cell wall biosynthesis n=1 Tax=Methanohalophilus euhalobius TaxID=51203 RepID=A0A314ZYC0_9EURY|nr:glycosyltransferase family 2 protein [Methanohalophilus euhalobius]PQV43133.1 glycosyltransferase involved in cell wall biosynthesis [Methanohalophilus euhalobius]